MIRRIVLVKENGYSTSIGFIGGSYLQVGIGPRVIHGIILEIVISLSRLEEAVNSLQQEMLQEKCVMETQIYVLST